MEITRSIDIKVLETKETAREIEEEESEKDSPLSAVRKDSRDWSLLPGELLELIASKNDLRDYFRFGIVCKEWQSSIVFKHIFPAVMLPSPINSENRRFFCLYYGSSFNIHLPQLYGKHVGGSSQGWLITVDLTSHDIELLQPLLKCSIKLPSLVSLDVPLRDEDIILPHHRRYIQKIALSSNPTSCSHSWLLVAITWVRQRLVFWRPEDKSWTWIGSKEHTYHVQEIIFYKQKLYVLPLDGPLVAWDVGTL